MIDHIEIEGFKSLEKVSLDLGALNIFVGTNASGKSNFLDALRVLQGIGYGYTIDEIFNGKPKGANSDLWEGIRGGSKYAGFLGSAHDIRFRVKRTALPSDVDDYNIGISPSDNTVTEESCSDGSGNVCPLAEDLRWDSSRPRLRQALEEQPNFSFGPLLQDLLDVQSLAPAPAILRNYSMASRAIRMGDHGENFAALIKAIQVDQSRASAYVSWLKELTPAELDSVEILPGAAGDSLFALRKGGVVYPATVLSDGTLRFAAIAAAFFQPSLPQTLILEEIEDGLHPTRLRLLVELLKSQAGKGISQVMATSHSPYAISWLKEEDYRYVFLCKKDDQTGATSVTPFSAIPRLMELARTQPIADLFAEGWLESAV